jgi:hypothetical protein
MSDMKRILFVALLVATLTPGCGEKSGSSGSQTVDTPSQSTADPSQATKPSEAPASAPIAAPIPSPAASTTTGTNAVAPPDVGQLTFQLRRWIVMNHRAPKTFEEFVSLAKIQVPPPPPGKKYVIGPQAKVILADR